MGLDAHLLPLMGSSGLSQLMEEWAEVGPCPAKPIPDLGEPLCLHVGMQDGWCS